MNGPSEHLTWAEMACHDKFRTPYPKEWRADRAVAIGKAFEYIRYRAGNLPITILSAYRTPAHNAAVGGARFSQHMEGRALDLQPPEGWTVARFHALIEECAAESVNQGWEHPIRGIGLYPSFVHVDVRPLSRFAAWEGSRPAADV